MNKISKIRIAKDLCNIIQPIDCRDCPLKEVCDLAEEHEFGSICRILDVEKEGNK